MTMRQDRITLYPVGRETRYPDLSCTGEGKPSKDGTLLREREVLLPWMRTVTRLSWLTSATLRWRLSYKLGRNTAPAGTRPVVR
jgi:hypothetical protein